MILPDRSLPSEDDQTDSERVKGLWFVLIALFFCSLSSFLSGCSSGVKGQTEASALIASPSSINLGSVVLGKSTNATVSLVNQGSRDVSITQLSLMGTSFSVAGQNSLPVTIAAGTRYNLSIQFNPASSGPATGQLTVASDAPSSTTTVISLSGTGESAPATTPALNKLSCNSPSIVGTGTDLCTVTINAAAPNGGFSVDLLSSDPAVTVPSPVLIPANSSSAQFTANVSSVLTARAVTLTASAGTVNTTFALQLNAAVPLLNVSAASVPFGSVTLNSPEVQTISFTSAGSAPVTIGGALVSGTGFTLLQSQFPMVLNPGQIIVLSMQFDPITVGTVTGKLTVNSNSSLGSSAAIALSGTGVSPGAFTYSGSSLLNTLAPPDPSMPISGSFFGMTIHHSATPFPSFPVSSLRFWDVTAWADIEPSGGQFVWTRMDNTISTGNANGVSDYIFTLGSVPTWASSDPSEPCTGGDGPGSCAPPDMAAFDDFVSHVVQRYCGVVKYYETWNEPNSSGYWSGNNAQLLTVAQHLYQLAKDPANCGCTNGVCSPNGGVNPNRVLTPTISRISQANLTWLDSYLGTAGTTYPFADIASFHGYGATEPEQILNQVQLLNKTLTQHNLSSLPLWNTEASWGAQASVDQDQASWLMRYHVALALAGVSRFVWYAYDNCGWGTLWEAPWCSNPQMPTGQLTDPGQAYGVLESWLTGANLLDCQQFENGLWSCRLQRPDNSIAWMLWSSTGTEISVPIPAESGLTVYRDWQDNVNVLPSELSIGQMPVLLEVEGH